MKEALTIPLKHEMEMSIKFLESSIIHENMINRALINNFIVLSII